MSDLINYTASDEHQTHLMRRQMYEALEEDAPYAEEEGQLYGYHSGTTHWETSRNTKVRFGFEAEKEDTLGQSIGKCYQGSRERLLAHNYKAERDGSLNYDGFELISPVYNLYSDKYIQHLSTPVLSFLIHSATSYRCGGHITLSVKGWGTEEYGVKTAQILPLLYALYPKRAKTSGYSRFYNKEDYSQRYNAINIDGEKMEIRIFSGIKSLKQLTWRVDLLKILFKFELTEGYDAIYANLLDTGSELARHIQKIYKKKYGEKIMLTHAYHKAYEIETLTWKDYTKIRTKIPTAVVNRMQVQPEPVYNNPKQLRLDVCDYCEEGISEA